MRVLHISDLHCGTSPVSGQDVIVNAMLDDVTQLAASKPIDLVVFTGDLANHGKAEEFERARSLLLDPLCRELALSPDRIVLTPGNHDIDQALILEFMEPGLKLLAKAEDVDRLVRDESQFAQATRRIDAWRSFRSGYYSDETLEKPNPLVWVHRFFFDECQVGVVVLDSSWRATGAPDNGDRELLIIGETQAAEALDLIEESTIRIVAFHHPLPWLTPGSHAFLRDELEHRGAIVLTGHEHATDPTLERSMRGSAIYSRAGSLYQGASFPNGYSLLDIDHRDHKVTMQLRSWMQPRKVFDAATDLTASGVIELPLPKKVGKGLESLPKYTTVTAALASIAQSRSLFSDQLTPEEPSSIDEVVVEPRLYKAPYAQVAAAAGIAMSQKKRIDQLRLINPLDVFDRKRVVILSGDPESGVTDTLLWILQQQYSRDADRVPVYVPFEIHSGKDPFDRDVRSAARGMALDAGPRDLLPPLIIAFDDVTALVPRALTRLATHIQTHTENLYVVGCHGDNYREIKRALDEHDVESTLVFVGPFGRRQTVRLMELAGMDEISESADRVLSVVFEENLPRSPFVLAALVTVLAKQPESKPPNVSTLLDAVIDLLLGKTDPSDREAGMDSRDREHILEVLAGRFTMSGTEKLARADAEEFLDKYFKERGIERSISPGHVLDSLIRRKILVEEADGVGFRHNTLQNVLAAKLMLEGGEFDTSMRSDPIRYGEVVRHAASLRRTDKELLDLVGRTASPAMKRIVGESPKLFDFLVGAGARPIDAEELDRRIKAVEPKSPEEREKELDSHYDLREIADSQPSTLSELPTLTLEAIQQTALLSNVLAGSELVSDVDMKTAYLKRTLMAWGAIAEVLGARTSDWDSLRFFFNDAFADMESRRQELAWPLFVRVSVILHTAVSISGVMASAGLGAAIRRLADDDDIMASPTYSLYLAILFVELGLPGYIEQLVRTYDRHNRHGFLADLSRMIALTRYISPATSDSDAQKLLNFLTDASEGEQVGREGVRQRSAHRSKFQTRLRGERARHQRDLVGEGLVEDLLSLDDGED